MTALKHDLPTPAEVVDYALALAGPERCPHMVSKIGRFARWNPLLLHRADIEMVRRTSLLNNRGALNWQGQQQYHGARNAILKACDSAEVGPRGVPGKECRMQPAEQRFALTERNTMTALTHDLPTPAEVVDYALALAGPERCPHMVSKIGRFACWNSRLLHRADIEIVRRMSLLNNRGALNWDGQRQYTGARNAILKAYDGAEVGPSRGGRR